MCVCVCCSGSLYWLVVVRQERLAWWLFLSELLQESVLCSLLFTIYIKPPEEVINPKYLGLSMFPRPDRKCSWSPVQVTGGLKAWMGENQLKWNPSKKSCYLSIWILCLLQWCLLMGCPYSWRSKPMMCGSSRLTVSVAAADGGFFSSHINIQLQSYLSRRILLQRCMPSLPPA